MKQAIQYSATERAGYVRLPSASTGRRSIGDVSRDISTCVPPTEWHHAYTYVPRTYTRSQKRGLLLRENSLRSNRIARPARSLRFATVDQFRDKPPIRTFPTRFISLKRWGSKLTDTIVLYLSKHSGEYFSESIELPLSVSLCISTYWHLCERENEISSHSYSTVPCKWIRDTWIWSTAKIVKFFFIISVILSIYNERRYDIIWRKRSNKISKKETLEVKGSSNYYSSNSHKLNLLLALTKVYKTAKAVFQETEITYHSLLHFDDCFKWGL